MTIMARIYSRSNEQPPLHICRELKRLLSRFEQDTAVEFGNNRVWMAKMDIGAFGSPGSYFDDRRRILSAHRRAPDRR